MCHNAGTDLERPRTGTRLPTALDTDDVCRDDFTGNGVRRGMQAAIPMGIGVAVYGGIVSSPRLPRL